MPADRIARSMQDHRSLLETFQVHAEELAGFAGRVVDTFNRGGKVLILGSGPLGAVANLVATQFIHRFSLDRPPLPVFSLAQDAVLATSLERNEQGRQFFARQVQVLAAPGDIVLVLHGAGRDEALAEVLAVARQADCVTAVFLPGREESAGEPVDFLFRLETDSAPRGIEGALFFGHLLCELVEAELFGI